MKPCPICSGKLKFHKSTMSDYSWLDPYVDCNNPLCGFSYSQDKTRFSKANWEKGQGGWEHDRKNKDSAEKELRALFEGIL